MDPVAEPARPAHLRKANQKLLLQLLRQNSPCSKADLARVSGLTAPTVAMAIGDLMDRGVVEDCGEGVSSGGRPPSMLRFNATYGYVAAADIGGTRIRMMIADLSGNAVAEWETQIGERHKTTRGVIHLVQHGLKVMTARLPPNARVLHITAGAPGITDVQSGTVLAAPNLSGWNDVPLRTLLERTLEVPASVENDTNLAAVGEHAEGVARGVQDFIFIAMGTGVGAGMFLRGALHRGANWSAGEIGYLPVIGMPRQRVQMRDTGQMERAIGGAGVEARWRELLKQKDTPVNSLLAGLRPSEIFDLAAEGDATAEQVLQETARVLADGLSSVALLFNPEMIVLGGGVGSHAALCRAANDYLRQNSFALPMLRCSSLGTKAQLFGAISLSLAAVEAQLLY